MLPAAALPRRRRRLPPRSGAEERAAGAAVFQLAYGGEAPVTAADAEAPFPGVAGNAWHWCEDWIAALPGSRGVHPFYDDFSTPCYDGQHAVIVGGSFASTGAEASATARFHFRPHFHQHAGFRLARSAAPLPLSHVDSPPPHAAGWDPSSRAARDGAAGGGAATLAMALHLHYPDAAHPSPRLAAGPALEYAQAAAAPLLAARGTCGAAAGQRALEVGCSVGGLSFELAGHFADVVAVDLSADAVAAAQRMQREGHIEYECADCPPLWALLACLSAFERLSIVCLSYHACWRAQAGAGRRAD